MGTLCLMFDSMKCSFLLLLFFILWIWHIRKSRWCTRHPLSMKHSKLHWWTAGKRLKDLRIKIMTQLHGRSPAQWSVNKFWTITCISNMIVGRGSASIIVDFGIEEIYCQHHIHTKWIHVLLEVKLALIFIIYVDLES